MAETTNELVQPIDEYMQGEDYSTLLVIATTELAGDLTDLKEVIVRGPDATYNIERFPYNGDLARVYVPTGYTVSHDANTVHIVTTGAIVSRIETPIAES